MLSSKKISAAASFIKNNMENRSQFENYKKNHYLQNDDEAIELLDRFAAAREKNIVLEEAQDMGQYEGRPTSKATDWDEDGEEIDWVDEPWFVDLCEAAKTREEELADAVYELEILRREAEDDAYDEELRRREEKDWEDDE